ANRVYDTTHLFLLTFFSFYPIFGRQTLMTFSSFFRRSNFLAVGAFAAVLALSFSGSSQNRRTGDARSVRDQGIEMPQYEIFDIGVVQEGDSASQGFRVSPGGIAVGRSLRSGGAQRSEEHTSELQSREN